MKNKINQVNLINDFFKSSEINLIINDYNEEITVFYLNLIKYFTYENKVKIKFDENNGPVDLFENRSISVYKTTSTKNIEKLINSSDKKIIFADYKNFKKFNKSIIAINTYHYEQDVKIYITQKFEINDNSLISFCQNNPVLAFSEITKYLVNNNNYTNDEKLNTETNHILNIRKSIFMSKRERNNIKDLYNLIKSEADYKKFSFLTY